MAVGRVAMMQVYSKINALGAQLRQRNVERNWTLEDNMESSIKKQVGSIDWSKKTHGAQVFTTMASFLGSVPEVNALLSAHPEIADLVKPVQPTLQMMSAYNTSAYEETKTTEVSHQGITTRQMDMNSSAQRAFADMVKEIHDAAINILSSSHQTFTKAS